MFACLLASCSSDASFFIVRPWADDQYAIAVVTDSAGKPLEMFPRVIAPGAKLEVTRTVGEPFRVFVRAFPKSDRFERCGLRFGGEGVLLPDPAGAWKTALVDRDSGDALALEVDGAPQSFDVRFENCDGPCNLNVVKLETEPLAGDPLRVVMVSRDLAFFAGSNRSETSSVAVFGRIDGDRVTVLQAGSHVISPVRGMVYDGADTIYAIANQMFVVFDREGRERSAVYAGGEPQSMTIAADAGPFIRFDPSRVDEYRPMTRDFVTVQGIMPDPEQFLAIRRDHLFSFGTEGSISRFDGATWRVELTGSESAWDAIAGDEEVVVAAPRIGNYVVRKGDDPEWPSAGRPFDPFPNGAAVAGRGRAIVVGDGGSAAMWLGDRWCIIETNTELGLNWVATSPDRTRAIIVGARHLPDGAPVVLAFDLP